MKLKYLECLKCSSLREWIFQLFSGFLIPILFFFVIILSLVSLHINLKEFKFGLISMCIFPFVSSMFTLFGIWMVRKWMNLYSCVTRRLLIAGILYSYVVSIIYYILIHGFHTGRTFSWIYGLSEAIFYTYLFYFEFWSSQQNTTRPEQNQLEKQAENIE